MSAMMKSKRRRPVSDESDLQQQHQQDSSDEDDERMSSKRKASSYRVASRKGGVVVVVLLVAAGAAIVTLRSLKMTKLQFLKVLTFLPSTICLILAAATFYRHRTNNAKKNILLQNDSGITLPLVLAVSSLGSYLPISVAAALANAAIFAFTVSTRTTASSSTTKLTQAPPISRILMAVVLLVVIMLAENFCIWVVSATFAPGFSASTQPPALQDNGQRLIRSALRGITKRQLVGLRRVLNVQWSLVGCFCASVWLAERHPTRHFHTVATRAVCTLALARFIRTVSFGVTVLPSQIVGCFLERFQTPPDEWWPWIQVGFLPAAHGGCNDLIISGHATVTSTLACVSVSFHRRVFAAVLLSLLWVDYFMEIYEGFHYSVDMWLGFVLVNLIWRSLAFLEDLPVVASGKSSASSPSSTRTSSIDTCTAIVYAVPSIISFLQIAWFPRSWVNGWIVAFIVIGAISFAIPGAGAKSVLHGHHLAQHMLLCTLCIALGVYL